jgi:hypothetical protein
MRYRLRTWPIAVAVLLFSAGCSYFDPVSGFGDDDLSKYSDTTAARQAGTVLTVNAHLVAGEHDWYSFAAVRDTTYALGTTGSLDTWMALYAPDSTTMLTSDDDDGVGANALITWTCLASDTYHVMVRGYSTSTSGDYSLYITK